MKWNGIDWLLALVGGFLLALMLDYNGVMSKHSTPLFSAMVLHGVGTIGALFFIAIFSRALANTKKLDRTDTRIPLWAYLGGIPGALGVLLAAILVNTSLSLAGTFALMLTGQIIFSIFLDMFGLLGQPKRKLILKDFFVTLCVFVGSFIIIFCGS